MEFEDFAPVYPTITAAEKNAVKAFIAERYSGTRVSDTCAEIDEAIDTAGVTDACARFFGSTATEIRESYTVEGRGILTEGFLGVPVPVSIFKDGAQIIVTVPAGTYEMGRLVIPANANVTIRGVGTAVLKAPDNAAYDGFGIVVSSGAQLVLDNLTLDANAINRAAMSGGHTIEAAGANLTIKNCHFTGTIHTALYAHLGSVVTIDKCDFDGNVTYKNGSYIYTNETKLSVSGSRFANVGISSGEGANQAFYCYQGDITIDGCVFENCGKAVDFRTDARGSVRNCIVIGGTNGQDATNGCAFETSSGAGVVIEDNRIAGIRASHVVDIRGSGAIIRRNNIQGIEDSESREQRVFYLNGSNALIELNDVYGTQYGNGVLIDMDTSLYQITGNLVSGNTFRHSRFLYRIVSVDVPKPQLSADMNVIEDVSFMLCDGSFNPIQNQGNIVEL